MQHSLVVNQLICLYISYNIQSQELQKHLQIIIRSRKASCGFTAKQNILQSYLKFWQRNNDVILYSSVTKVGTFSATKKLYLEGQCPIFSNIMIYRKQFYIDNIEGHSFCVFTPLPCLITCVKFYVSRCLQQDKKILYLVVK